MSPLSMLMPFRKTSLGLCNDVEVVTRPRRIEPSAKIVQFCPVPIKRPPADRLAMFRLAPSSIPPWK